LWVFVGVQIPGAVHHINDVHGGLRHALYIAFAVTGVVIVSRVLWVEATTALFRTFDRRDVQRARRVDWRQRTVTSWAGFRGAVSLAAALAVPLTTLSGAPFPDRSLLIFVVTVVILVTVLVQGSTLPLVVRWARMPEDNAHVQELQMARERIAEVGREALPSAARELKLNPELLNRLEKEYEQRAAVVRSSGNEDSGPNDLVLKKEKIRRVRLHVLDHQRQAVTALRNQNLIDDIVLRELQAEMDLEEVQLLDSGEE
jgi:monovalent cation/hydrogen antiporter